MADTIKQFYMADEAGQEFTSCVCVTMDGNKWTFVQIGGSQPTGVAKNVTKSK